MTKICYIIGQLTKGGAERQLFELISGLNKEHFEPAVISLSEGGYWVDRFTEIGVRVFSIPRKRNWELSRLFRLIAIIRKLRPDIVHTYLVSANTYGRIAAGLCGVRLIIASERNSPLAGHNKRRFNIWMDKLLLPITNMIICNADFIAQRLRSEYDFPVAKLCTIHNGISDPQSVPEAWHEVDGRSRRIITVGRLVPQKNHELFLLIAQQILQQNPKIDLEFVIIGDGELRHTLEKTAYDLNINHHVRLLGERNDIIEQLNSSSIFVLTSNYEGLSNAIMEAMVCGLPVVAADIGGNRELIAHNRTGFICKPSDCEDFAAKIQELMGNPSLAKSMGLRGRDKIRTSFSLEKMVRSTTDVYRDLGSAKWQADARGGKKMRLLLLGPLPPPVGGAAGVFKYLVDDLLQNPNLSAEVINTSRTINAGTWPKNLWVACKSLGKLITRIPKVDAVSFHASYRGFLLFGPWVRLICYLWRRPCLFRFFGGALDVSIQETHPAFRWIIRKAVLSAEVCLVETKHLVEHFKARGYDNVRWFSNYTRNGSAEKQIDESRACHRFVYLGHIRKSKGISTLLEASEYLDKSICVDLYGPLYDGFTESNIMIRGNERVHYRGVISKEEVFQRLNDYDALVHPTQHPTEGYPGAIVEGFSRGLPVVSTRWRAIPEIVDDTCGILVEPNDPKALASAMNHLKNEVDLFRSLRDGVRQRAGRFSDKEWTALFIRLTAEAVASKRSMIRSK